MNPRDFDNYYELLKLLEQNRTEKAAHLLHHHALKAQHDQEFRRFMQRLVGDKE